MIRAARPGIELDGSQSALPLQPRHIRRVDRIRQHVQRRRPADILHADQGVVSAGAPAKPAPFFFVWQQQREDFLPFEGDFRTGRETLGIFGRPSNVFLVKATYWFAR